MIPNKIISDKIKVKVSIVGATMGGKTTILSRMRYGVFNSDSIATVGASFVTLWKDNINYEVWDTAGQERYLSLIPMYFRDARIVLYVFDVNVIESIKYINKYKDILSDSSDIKIIVLGNKTDLLKEGEHSLEELTSEVYNNFENLMLTDKIHGLYFISAKDGNNFGKFLEHFYECGKTLSPSKPKLNNIIIDDLYIKNQDEDVNTEVQDNNKCC